MDAPPIVVIVAAHNEADRLRRRSRALGDGVPGRARARRRRRLDATTPPRSRGRARRRGRALARATIGKGGATTARRAARARRGARARAAGRSCSATATSATSAAQLAALADGGARRRAPTSPSPPSPGASAAASAWPLGFARWAIRRLLRAGAASAPISGQRALRGEVLAVVVPFAPRFGMEIGMTIDAARAGFRVVEVELDLEHRATGRTLRGFLHRVRQLATSSLVTFDRR